MIKLSEREWKAFKISDFFNCYTGKYYSKNKYTSGIMPLVTAKSQYNGISDWINIKDEECFENAITIGKVDATSFYQPFKFVCSSDVNVIKPASVKLNKYIAMFLCNQIMMQSSKFDYGNQIRLNDTKALKIMLPSTNNSPDFQFMEDYIKEKYFNLKSQIKEKQKHEIYDWRKLNEIDWENYFIEDVFNIKSGKRLTKDAFISGIKPFVGSTDSNNGITNYVANQNSSEDYNVLGVNYNGSVVENFYHPYHALFSDDVKRLSLKIGGNKYLYLFTKNVILKQKVKYQYGYKFNAKRMKKQYIKLPSINNQPDYNFMEQYMKRKENEVLERL